jgi:hypothetical protein
VKKALIPVRHRKTRKRTGDFVASPNVYSDHCLSACKGAIRLYLRLPASIPMQKAACQCEPNRVTVKVRTVQRVSNLAHCTIQVRRKPVPQQRTCPCQTPCIYARSVYLNALNICWPAMPITLKFAPVIYVSTVCLLFCRVGHSGWQRAPRSRAHKPAQRMGLPLSARSPCKIRHLCSVHLASPAATPPRHNDAVIYRTGRDS